MLVFADRILFICSNYTHHSFKFVLKEIYAAFFYFKTEKINQRGKITSLINFICVVKF